MDVKTKDQKVTLELIDPDTGVNWAQSYISNTGALDSEDGFWNDEEDDEWACTEETLDWWVKHLNEVQKVEDLKAELSEEYGYDTIQKIVAEASYCDLEDEPYYTYQALVEFSASQKS